MYSGVGGLYTGVDTQVKMVHMVGHTGFVHLQVCRQENQECILLLNLNQSPSMDLPSSSKNNIHK